MFKKMLIFIVIFTLFFITIFIASWTHMECRGNITRSTQESEINPVMIIEKYATRNNNTDDELESIDDEKDVFYYLFGPLCPLWLFILIVVGIISYVYHHKYKPQSRYVPPGPPPGQAGYSAYPQTSPYPPPPPPPTYQPTQNLCSYCQQPLTYISQYQKWYCNYCGRYA